MDLVLDGAELQISSEAASFLETLPLANEVPVGGADCWAPAAAGVSLCTASPRTMVWSFPVLRGFRSLSHSRPVAKVAPGLSGSASIFHDLIFLLKGQTRAAWGGRKSQEQELQTEGCLSSSD